MPTRAGTTLGRKGRHWPITMTVTCCRTGKLIGDRAASRRQRMRHAQRGEPIPQRHHPGRTIQLRLDGDADRVLLGDTVQLGEPENQPRCFVVLDE